ncbi:hypothetical protein [Pusillimonas sp.]|uniref:hypothetical protein n=1 Tax=Pusillimonas sp. TaxID=3040095 RepID=UPI0037C7D400
MSGNSMLRAEIMGAARNFLVDFLAFEADKDLLITTDTARAVGVVEALQAVAIEVGARFTTVTIPQLPYQGKLADPYLPRALVAAIKECDLWVDLTYPYIAGADAHVEAMKTEGLRYMLSSDMSAEAMIRMFGDGVLDALYPPQSELETLIANSVGKTMRMTTPSGTDVTFALAESLDMSPRRATRSGLHFLPGSCLIAPEIESVRGKIVLESCFHEYYTELREPIELEVDGRIQSVRGGGTERATMERALLRAGGGQYGYIIHFAHGMHPQARFTGECFVEDIRVVGSNAIGMGLPFWVPEGGENHPDGVATMQSVWLDGRQIIQDGQILDLPVVAKD